MDKVLEVESSQESIEILKKRIEEHDYQDISCDRNKLVVSNCGCKRTCF